MPSAATSDAAQPPTWRNHRAVRIAGYAARLAVAAVVVYLCYAGATTFTSLLRDEPVQVVEPSSVPTAAAIEPLDWAQIVAAGGGWHFDGTGWQVVVRTADDKSVQVALAAPIVDPAELPPQAETERSLVAALTPQLGMRTERDGGTDQSFDSPSFRFTVRTRDVGGVRRLSGGRAALRRGANQWTLLEARPDPQAVAAARPASHLLPYPADAVVVASRLDTSGAIGCQFVRHSGTLADLVNYWSRPDSAAERLTTTPIVTGAGGLQEFVVVRNGRPFRIAARTDAAGGTTLVVAAEPESVSPSATSSSNHAP